MASTHRTGEEIRDANIAAMGPELGELFTVLSFELTWLFMHWKQWLVLFTAGQARVDILNRTASMFFGLLQSTIWNETMLSITRLTAPERSMGKENLTIRRFPALVSDEQLSTKLQTAIDKLVLKTASAYDQRNRYIAHRDLALSLGRESRPLAPSSHQEVDEMLDSIAGILNSIESHYCGGSTTAYRTSVVTDDAESVLYYLRAGLRREEQRLEYLEKGEVRPEDWDEDNKPV
jgi:hypothetical protein